MLYISMRQALILICKKNMVGNINQKNYLHKKKLKAWTIA